MENDFNSGELLDEQAPDAGDIEPAEPDITGEVVEEEELLEEAPAAEDADADGSSDVIDEEQEQSQAAQEEYAVRFKTQNEFDDMLMARVHAAERSVEKKNAHWVELGKLHALRYAEGTGDNIDVKAVYDRAFNEFCAEQGLETPYQKRTVQMALKELGANGIQDGRQMSFTPERMSELDYEASIISQSDPSFNHYQLLQSNPMASALALYGFGLGEIVQAFPSKSAVDAAYKRGQADAVKNIQKRRAIPKPEKTTSATQERNIGKMSDAEFEQFDRDLQSGRVRLD